MIQTYSLSDSIIEYIANLPEVILGKESVISSTIGSKYFSVTLPEDIKNLLFQQMGINVPLKNEIPIRWVKGDTLPHIDRGNESFFNTYLAYLTDSSGTLIIDSVSYPITKGNGYIFSEGLSHQTVNTGSEPRLLIGPMNEFGNEVGIAGIYQPGGTTVYIRQNNSDIEYTTDQNTWSTLYFPITINNTDTNAGILTIEFISDISINDANIYFILSSEFIQLGSKSLQLDGSRPLFTVSVDNYEGLFRNGGQYNNGYSNISICNLSIEYTISNTITNPVGLLCGAYFGIGATQNYIINCSSNVSTNGYGSGAIVGPYAGSESGAELFIYACSGSGAINQTDGGIIGQFAGQNGGSVICENCWTTGVIYNGAGGIFGQFAGYNGGNAYAKKCYSNGTIRATAGGIFGRYAGRDGSSTAEKCYSTGNIGNSGGGIYGLSAANYGNNGTDTGSTSAINCYSSGIITTNGTGIYGSGKGTGAYNTNCYYANGNWNSSSANSSLSGTPSPYIGTTWVFTGINQPYELLNMGYIPYSITNISNDYKLIQTYTEQMYAGESSSSAIINSKNYVILEKSGGNSSSYSSITIDNTTGIINTTNNTIPGTYSLYIRNEGSYNITLFTLTVDPPVISNIPICFIKGTPILTDQGEIPIEKINPAKNTIRGENIIGLITSIPLDSYLICIEKNALGKNIPNRKTILSKDHKIIFNGTLIESEKIITKSTSSGIYKIKYNNTPLYNILLQNYSIISVNNLLCETLHPNNILAKLHTENICQEDKNKILQTINLQIKNMKENEITTNKKRRFSLF